MRKIGWWVWVVAAGCGSTDGRNTDDSATTGSSVTGESGAEGGASTAGDSGGEGTTDSETDTTTETTEGPKLDIPAGETSGTAETGTDDGCKKVDFLFVIDNSGSMSDEQDRLAAAFPGFIDTIQNTVEGQDHHIMVVDSDESAAWVCEEFQSGGHCTGGLQQPNCNGYTCGLVDSLGACDRTLGGGVVFAYGGNTANMACGFPPDRRYLTDQDADLESAFACAAKVGTSGNSVERPFSAMVAALDPAINGPGGCNEGFLRDDAVLVITIVTDDPPIGSGDDALETDPMPWYDAVVAAKNDDPEAVVVIGLLPTLDTSCVVTNGATPVFEDFMTLWGDHGITASVCDMDYAAIFDQAVGVVDSTCDDFIPPG